MLKEYLLNYTKEVYPMHMPGHKGGRYRLLDDLYKVDVTEVPETDHLYHPEGILAESLAGLTEFYGTKKSIFLVNGSTVGLLSAIGGLHQPEDEVLIARNCHQSVYNAVTMYKLHPRYIYPKMTQWGLLGGIDPEEVRKILSINPMIVSFVMTSPTYDGFISDIKSINEVCKRYNVTLIVDEAHGAHLPYSKALPSSALEAGAGVVVHSMHKTLPVITGAGLLHLNLPEDQEKSVIKMLSRLQTSSPSYIMMAQIDACVHKLGNNEKLWTEHLKNIEDVNKSLKKMKKLYAVTEYASLEEGIIAQDPGKSIIMARGSVDKGHDLSRRMRNHHKIQMELNDALHILGIITVADTKKALSNYGRALIKMDRRTKKNTDSHYVYRVPDHLEIKMQPYEADEGVSESVTISESPGRIAASMITPYPPGIPAVVPGEMFTATIAASIDEWLAEGMDVLGVDEGVIQVIIEA